MRSHEKNSKHLFAPNSPKISKFPENPGKVENPGKAKKTGKARGGLPDFSFYNKQTGTQQANVFLLGAANGGFAVAAIGAMMVLASQGQQKREGIRMGMWGAAQAIAFALGGFLGTVAVDVTLNCRSAKVENRWRAISQEALVHATSSLD